ncbi:MAG: hypothetical protein VKL60_14475 [Sphaerospermopsis sp.]|nr:hypothetical protein [Sphaerospermopsis sp.]
MNLNPLKKDEQKEEVTGMPFMYTEDQLMARLKFFIGICLSLTLTGIVFVVLYSIIFVTQPLNAMSPIDQKFFELLIPISTFLTGILSGIMLAGKDDKEARMKAIEAATRPTSVSSNPTPTSPSPLGSVPNIPRPMPSMGMPAAPMTPPAPPAPPAPDLPPVSSAPPAPPNIPRPPVL